MLLPINIYTVLDIRVIANNQQKFVRKVALIYAFFTTPGLHVPLYSISKKIPVPSNKQINKPMKFQQKSGSNEKW